MQVVLNYLKQNQARAVAELCELLRFPSVSAQPQHKPDLRACAQWLVRHCRQIGLQAKLCPTAGHPIVLAKTPRAKGQRRRPHYMVYGHYDVQPPEPLDLWHTPPFEPRIEGRSVYARGSTDNKGQFFAHLKAVEAYLQTGTPLPCDLTFVLEGEEEVGSKSLSHFLKTHRRELACDAVVISDTGMPGLKHPALTYALRGIIAFEITLHGPERDLHSGVFGGAVDGSDGVAQHHRPARSGDEPHRIETGGLRGWRLQVEFEDAVTGHTMVPDGVDPARSGGEEVANAVGYLERTHGFEATDGRVRAERVPAVGSTFQPAEPVKSMVRTPAMISPMPRTIVGVSGSPKRNFASTATSATPQADQTP